MNELLIKYFSGNASSEEEKEVESWRSASRENAQDFLESSELWFQKLQAEKVDENAAFRKVMEEIESTDQTNHFHIAASTSNTGSNWLKYAAGILVALGLGLAYFFLGNTEKGFERYVATEFRELELKDGSVVTLQEGAELSVSETFNEDVRLVRLSGKAFFDIARNEAVPFIIEGSGANIEVLGTSFLVNSNKKAGTTEVIVSSGVVALSGEAELAENKIVLTEGERGVAEPRQGKLTKGKNYDINYLSWKNRIIEFDETQMVDVIDLIEEVYNSQIIIEDNAIRGCTLTAKFDQKSLDSILEIIDQTFGFTVTKSGSKYVLSGDGC